LILHRELSRRVQADLVEHAPDINEPADLGVTTPQSGYVGHEGWNAVEACAGQTKSVYRPARCDAVPSTESPRMTQVERIDAD
jgi:hypothetical protein